MIDGHSAGGADILPPSPVLSDKVNYNPTTGHQEGELTPTHRAPFLHNTTKKTSKAMLLPRRRFVDTKQRDNSRNKSTPEEGFSKNRNVANIDFVPHSTEKLADIFKGPRCLVVRQNHDTRTAS